jgi:hypothetical protein
LIFEDFSCEIQTIAGKRCGNHLSALPK